MRDDLVSAIRDRRAILFAGAGVSMTVGLPSWSTLIAQMAEELGLDPKVAEDPGTNYFTLAEYYRLRQWDPDSGAISHEVLTRLDLPEPILAARQPIAVA